MICPKCGEVGKVVDSRGETLQKRRRRECRCGNRYTTLETTIGLEQVNVAVEDDGYNTVIVADAEIDRIEAENTELRHALTDARAVIAEIVDRVQPLVPFILAESERLRR